MFSRKKTISSTTDFSQKIEALKNALVQADAVLIGAGAGLSTAAGLTYTGKRFERYFSDFAKIYSFQDMYSGGFTPFASLAEQWAYWSRYIYINRYTAAPRQVYPELLSLVQGKDYFVLTTNVDHQFQRAGFDRTRLFYTQGDFGLWQCSEPCHDRTYDNADTVLEMVQAQGFLIDENGILALPEGTKPRLTVPEVLIPHCPVCGKPMRMNLRADETFVEDDGWHAAADRYIQYVRSHEGKRIVYLELGVGNNTPGIIKYPFWQATYENPHAVYACLNFGEAVCPRQIERQSILINADIADIIKKL